MSEARSRRCAGSGGDGRIRAVRRQSDTAGAGRAPGALPPADGAGACYEERDADRAAQKRGSAASAAWKRGPAALLVAEERRERGKGEGGGGQTEYECEKETMFIYR